MKTALITSTGSAAADIAVKSLKRMGFRVIGCNIYPKEWIVESGEVDVFYQSPPISGGDVYLRFIQELCLKESIEYVLPMIDYEIDLLATVRAWFESRGIVLCMSSNKSLDILRNKKKLAEFVAENCPQTKSIPTKLLRDIEKPEWDFPVVCKPYNGRSSQGLKYVHNQQEWDEFVKTADKDTYIVEPYIDGPIVMVETVRQAATNKIATMTRRELMSTPHGLSTSVLVFQDAKLEASTRILAEKLDVNGDVNFEYILDPNGDYFLVECNPRFSAGCEFSCIGGYECVENHIRCFMGTPIEEYHFKHNMIIARKYEEYITAIDQDVAYGNTVH